MPETFDNGYAVVVGVGADLPVTVDDATAIAEQLTNPSRCAYPNDQVRLLTSNDANRSNILDRLDWLAEVTKKEDTAIVYFSGHGMESPDYYLMPYGYDLNNLDNTAIQGKIFTAYLRAIKAKKLLVLLDCCHAGGQAEAKGVIKSPLPNSVIEQFKNSSGRVVLASSRKNEVSWTGKPYSVFTAAVLEGLSGYGSFEQDGYARVLDLAMWVGRKVPERTKEKQNPIIKVSNLEDNFALAWYAAGNKQPQPLPKLSTDFVSIASDLDKLASLQKRWKNYRENLMLIEERMSEYIDSIDIPLQLIKSKRRIEKQIADLEDEMGLG